MTRNSVDLDANVMQKIALKHPAAFALLMFMIQKMDKDNKLSMAQGQIAELMDVTRRSVNQSMRTLQEHGLISVSKNGNDLVYIVHDSSALPVADASDDLPRPIDGRTALYRHYSKEDELLYVGISLSAAARLSQHMRGSAWAGDVTRVAIEYWPDRAHALAAEKAAIQKERPRWNKVYNKGEPAHLKIYVDAIPRLFGLQHGFNRVFLSLASSIDFDGIVVVSAKLKKRIAETVGCTEKSVSNAIAALVKEGRLHPVGPSEYKVDTSILARG
jgi:biotin operon repressor/predicted GIY-YIG superfamily endonuclease